MEKEPFVGKIHFQNVVFLKCVRKVNFVTPVMFQGGTDVSAYTAVRTESGSGIGRRISNNLCAWWCKRSTVVIVIAENRSMGRKRRVNSGRPKQIQSENSLRKKAIPFGDWKIGIDSRENGNKVIF